MEPSKPVIIPGRETVTSTVINMDATVADFVQNTVLKPTDMQNEKYFSIVDIQHEAVASYLKEIGCQEMQHEGEKEAKENKTLETQDDNWNLGKSSEYQEYDSSNKERGMTPQPSQQSKNQGDRNQYSQQSMPPRDRPPEYYQEAYGYFEDPEVRKYFMAKVFFLTAMGLGITAIAVSAVIFNEDMRVKFRTPTAVILACVILLIWAMILMSCQCCCWEMAARNPAIGVMMLIFTVAAQSFFVAVVAAKVHPKAVGLAVIITFAAVLAIAILAIFIPFDITKCGVLLYFAGMIVMFLVSLAMVVNIFLKLKVLAVVICVVVALLLTVYIAFDIQMIMGGRTNQYEPEDWVWATIALYWDIISLFTMILQLIGIIDS